MSLGGLVKYEGKVMRRTFTSANVGQAGFRQPQGAEQVDAKGPLHLTLSQPLELA